MHSTGILYDLFLVVLPALALPPVSNSATSTSSISSSSSSSSITSSSSTNVVASLLATITSSSAPPAGPSPDPAVASDFASLASEFGAFETIIAKEFKSLSSLTSNPETSDTMALIAANEELAYKLAQAQSAIAASKQLALRQAKLAQSEIEAGKKACSLVQSQLDKWADIGLATYSLTEATVYAETLVSYIYYPVSLFTQQEAALGCPAKGTGVCGKVEAVIGVFNQSQQAIIDILETTKENDNEQALREAAEIVVAAAKNIDTSIRSLQDALMC